jgi:hypothetical protein
MDSQTGGKSMLRGIVLSLFISSLLIAGAAGARDVACGEKCDTKMNQCLATCEKPPEAERAEGDKYEVCQNECAKSIFHPCLDACKMPKPAWATD